MANRKIRNIPFLNKLYFHVYVIGYKKQGESIVFLLENDFGIEYAGIIDTYEINGTNHAINILKEKGIKKIDLFCWTHPHVDHSLGISCLMDEFIDNNSLILVPSNIYKIKYDYDHECISDSMEYIIENFTSRKKIKPRIKPVSDTCQVDFMYLGTGFKNSKFTYQLEIKSLTPVSEISEKRYFTEKINNLNDFSISLVINIGEVSYFFGGDIQDTSITKIDAFGMPEKIDYLKIPHHSSNGSMELLEYLNADARGSIATTTEYASSKLPDYNVLDEYSKFFSEIFVTQTLGEKENDFGVIHTTYDVLNNTFYNYSEGNAFKYFDVKNNC